MIYYSWKQVIRNTYKYNYYISRDFYPEWRYMWFPASIYKIVNEYHTSVSFIKAFITSFPLFLWTWPAPGRLLILSSYNLRRRYLHSTTRYKENIVHNMKTTSTGIDWLWRSDFRRCVVFISQIDPSIWSRFRVLLVLLSTWSLSGRRKENISSVCWTRWANLHGDDE